MEVLATLPQRPSSPHSAQLLSELFLQSVREWTDRQPHLESVWTESFQVCFRGSCERSWAAFLCLFGITQPNKIYFLIFVLILEKPRVTYLAVCFDVYYLE